MDIEIKRPGSDVWETSADAGGRVPLGDVVGALVRYPFGGSFLVAKVVGLSEPDARGVRHMQMEVCGGE